MAKAIVVIGLISIVPILAYLLITEQGMFGNEEEHIVTILGKDREFYFDSGCWNQWFTDKDGNIYNTGLEIYTKIQPEHTYYIKTGRRNILNGRWYAYYIKEFPRPSNNVT